MVEADVAACLYKGAKAGDGAIRIVDGDMQTIMAGLACGEPNTISWDILKNHVSTFVSAPDWVAAKGMRMLAAPIKGDPQVTSGESGAAPFGVLACIMMMDEYKELRDQLGLNSDSKVLLFKLIFSFCALCDMIAIAGYSILHFSKFLKPQREIFQKKEGKF